MNLTFLHPEFFLWMIPPVALLFYFWLTQQSAEQRWLSPETVRKLRAPHVTMGLQGRNILFLVAVILLIAAMAQPVWLQPSPQEGARNNLLVSVDLTAESRPAWEEKRSLAVSTVAAFDGNPVGIVGFDREFFRVSPLSLHNRMLTSLMERLPYRGAGRSDWEGMLATLRKRGELQGIDGIILVSAGEKGEIRAESAPWTAVVGRVSDIASVQRHVQRQEALHRKQWHVPLFFYPLGAAMILILIALSSMSKRESVSIALAGALLFVPAVPLRAGLLDFTVLHEAVAAYERGEYRQSERRFAEYQRFHDSPQVRYNRANALYRQGKFREARYWYEQVHTSDPELALRTRKNLQKTLERLEPVSKKGDKERHNGGENRIGRAQTAVLPAAGGEGKTPLFRLR